MSPRSRSLPRRSCLSVPASNPKMVAKAAGLAADMVFLDLEDSVAAGEKVAARAAVAAAVGARDWGDKVLGVRVNAWDSPFTVGDLLEVVATAGPRLDIVMLPKAQSAAEVQALDLVLRQVELTAGLEPGSVGIEVQIESARGLLDVAAICAASPRLEAVHLGPGDLAASLELPVISGGLDVPEYPGDHFHSVYVSILVAARAAGIQALDGPYFRIGDVDGLRSYAQRPRTLGYDGKWAIHPEQIPVINEVFSPTVEQYERARAMVDAMERAASTEGRGAVRFGDEMIDEASRKMALKLVARGERAGLAEPGR